MRDTPEFIAQMQVDIILAKPMRERILRTMEMMQMTFTMAENRLKRTYPFLTYPQLRAEMFREMYRNDFQPDKLAEIAGQIEAFWEKKME